MGSFLKNSIKMVLYSVIPDFGHTFVCGTIGPGFEPQHVPACRYVEEIGSAAMLTTKRSAGVAPDVNLREHVTCTSLASANKAAHSDFETQRRRHQKSETGISVAPQKGLMSSKKCLLRNVIFIFHSVY